MKDAEIPFRCFGCLSGSLPRPLLIRSLSGGHRCAGRLLPIWIVGWLILRLCARTPSLENIVLVETWLKQSNRGRDLSGPDNTIHYKDRTSQNIGEFSSREGRPGMHDGMGGQGLRRQRVYADFCLRPRGNQLMGNFHMKICVLKIKSAVAIKHNLEGNRKSNSSNAKHADCADTPTPGPAKPMST